MADLFSVPEMYLMLTVTEFFVRNHIDYHPEILFRDVKVRWIIYLSDFPLDDGNKTKNIHIYKVKDLKSLFLPLPQNAIGSSHPVMHKIVGEHVKEYIKELPDMRKFFERLVNANKKLFLVTNSPFHFVWVPQIAFGSIWFGKEWKRKGCE